jgi:hypothetical protein
VEVKVGDKGLSNLNEAKPRRQYEINNLVSVGPPIATVLGTSNALIVGYKWGGQERHGRKCWVYTLTVEDYQGPGLTPVVDVFEYEIAGRIS